MDEDVCGHETANGTPCQHPASDGDSCWLPSHGGNADTNGGRDFAISESDYDDILDAARKGMSKAGCARAAGVDEKSLQRYLDAHDKFRRTFMRARHRGEERLVAGPLTEPEHPDEPEMDGQHARFLLSTSFGYQKTEKREMEHATAEGDDNSFGPTIVFGDEPDTTPDDASDD